MKSLKLRDPVNRLGFTLLCFGAFLIVVSFLSTYKGYGWSGLRFADLETLFIDRSRYWWQTGIRLGAVLVVAGAWMAWAFEPTIGKLLRWIRTGSA